MGSMLLHSQAVLAWLLMAIFGTGPIIEYITWDRVASRVEMPERLCALSIRTGDIKDFRRVQDPIDCAEARRIRDADPQTPYDVSRSRYARVVYDAPGGGPVQEALIQTLLGSDRPPYRHGERVTLVVRPGDPGSARALSGWQDWWYILAGLVLLPACYLYAFAKMRRRRQRYAW